VEKRANQGRECKKVAGAGTHGYRTKLAGYCERSRGEMANGYKRNMGNSSKERYETDFSMLTIKQIES